MERFTVKTCCGGKSIIFKTDVPLDKDLIKKLIALGFKELEHFTKVGIIYMDNSDFIITGPLGSNRLQVKCKKQDCDQKLNNFETLLQQII